MEKKPFLTEAMAQQIIEDVPTPFHVYDEKGIRENVRRINKAFSWNKGFKEYFAVKALPNPVILQILKEEGCGVDCSSLTELMLSEVCGFTGHDIMFSSNQTPVEDMKKAYELGAYINLDDATMVEFLERVAGVPQEIFCRYNPGGTFQLGESEEGFQVMDKPGDAKYGMTEQQMIDSYKKLMQKGAKQFGIHAFLASNTISDAYYPELAGILFQLAVRVQQATGAHISYINLSGGVGIPYRPEQTENDIMSLDSSDRVGTAMTHLYTYGTTYYVTTESEDESKALIAAPAPVLNEGDTQAALRSSSRGLGDYKYITADCKNVEACIALLDALYLDDIDLELANGEEGVGYHMEDGVPVINAMASDASTDELLGAAPQQWHTFEDTDLNYILTKKYNKGCQPDALTLWKEQGTSQTLSNFILYNTEEAETRSSYQADVDTYVKESLLKFVMGKEPLDNFETFQQNLKDMHIEDLIAVEQAALDRYNAR